MCCVYSGCAEVIAGAGKVDGVNHIGYISPLHRTACNQQHLQGQPLPTDGSRKDSHLLPKHTVSDVSTDLAEKPVGHKAVVVPMDSIVR